MVHPIFNLIVSALFLSLSFSTAHAKQLSLIEISANKYAHGVWRGALQEIMNRDLPLRISSLPQYFALLSAGNNHALFNSAIKNNMSVLDDRVPEDVITAINTSKPFHVKKAFLQPFHSLILTEAGDLLGAGHRNYLSSGSEMFGTANTIAMFQKIAMPKSEKIYDVSSSQNFTLALSTNNKVFVFGKNDFGQLGLGHKNRITVPTELVIPNENITQVFALFEHAFFLTANGEIYATGKNEFGQLGVGDYVDKATPVKVTLPPNERVAILASGRHHTIIVTKNNKVYAFGANEYGQLGVGDESNRATPTLVSIPGEPAIKQVVVSATRTFIVTAAKALYGFGENSSEQLGVGLGPTVTRPTKITIGNNVGVDRVVAATDYEFEEENFYIFTVDGSLMGFGENQHGELCFGNDTPQTTPRKIQLPEPIKDAFTSEVHTIFLGTSGKIYLCGSLERPKGEKFFTPKFADDRDIVEKVFVGPDSSMVVTNSNDIFFAGFDGFNQSGLTRSLPDDQIRKERIFRLIPFDFRLRPDLFGWLPVTLRGKKTLSEVSLVDAVSKSHQRKKFKPN